MNGSHDKSRRFPRDIPGGWAAIVAAIIVAFGGGLVGGFNIPTEPVSTPTVTQTVTQTVTRTETVTVKPPPTPTDPPPTPIVQPATWDLALKQATSTQWCKWPGNTGMYWRTMSVKLADKSYPAGIACLMAQGASEGYLMFDLVERPGANRFTATVGIDSDGECSSSVKFSVRDGFSSELMSEIATSPGEAKVLDADVTERTKIKLQVNFDEVKGNLRNETCRAVWGEPRLMRS